VTQGSTTSTIVAPLAGRVVDLADVPDRMFASKVMGDGFGLVPDGDEVAAPASGTIAMVAHTA